jgi:hypothetical protein
MIDGIDIDVALKVVCFLVVAGGILAFLYAENF